MSYVAQRIPVNVGEKNFVNQRHGQNFPAADIPSEDGAGGQAGHPFKQVFGETRGQGSTRLEESDRAANAGNPWSQTTRY